MISVARTFHRLLPSRDTAIETEDRDDRDDENEYLQRERQAPHRKLPADLLRAVRHRACSPGSLVGRSVLPSLRLPDAGKDVRQPTRGGAMRSPINASAGWISQRTQRTQVRMATAMVVLIAGTPMVWVAIGAKKVLWPYWGPLIFG